MKKYFTIMAVIMIAAPVFAVCSITGGACSPSPNWQTPTLQEKYLPDNLSDIQKTNAFQGGYFEPYHDALINTESATINKPASSDYNSNCQFGVCLPEVKPGGEIVE